MTPDEAAFLKAITDNPADETARLVYADWLADRDDPRAAFARLSAAFLRCVRGLADARKTLPVEWLNAVDPLFNRLRTLRLPAIGEGIEGCTVTAVFVASGNLVGQGQPLFEVETDKAMMNVVAEEAGTIVSVLVSRGDRIPLGQMLLTYLAQPGAFPPVEQPAPVPPPPPPPPPRVPRAPFAAFIKSLADRREVLRSASPSSIDALIARQWTAAVMVFGVRSVLRAQEHAQERLGWGAARQIGTQMRSRGISEEQMPQVWLDVHIETLRVLLEQHGQPDEFRGLMDDPLADG